VRQALFNILGPLEDSSWLELYAGTGSVGLEALSRGARQVVFVERNPRLAKGIMGSLAALGLQKRAYVIENDVTGALRRLARERKSFDIIFADPPYNRGFVATTLSLCQATGVVREGGQLIIQASLHEKVSETLLHPPGKELEMRRYGDTVLYFLNSCPLASGDMTTVVPPLTPREA